MSVETESKPALMNLLRSRVAAIRALDRLRNAIDGAHDDDEVARLRGVENHTLASAGELDREIAHALLGSPWRQAWCDGWLFEMVRPPSGARWRLRMTQQEMGGGES